MLLHLLTGILLLAGFGLVGWLLHSQRIQLSVALLGNTLLLLIFRLCYIATIETGPDASIWLASAQTVSKLSDPVWSLLTTNEGRPLTVLPLVLLHQIGIPLTYVWADVAGILMYAGAFAIAASLMAKLTNALQAWLLSCILFATLATVSIIDYTSYNCQAPSLLITMYCLHLLHGIWQQSVKRYHTVLLGILLGSLPLFKFQNAPAGMLIGVAACALFLFRKQWQQLILIAATALLPVALVAFFFWQRGLWADFMNDYFNNYFFYAYTEDYAGDSYWHRYSPRRVFSFLLRTTDSAILIAGAFGMLAIAILQAKRKAFSNVPQWFLLLFLLANFYAVIQSGWNTPHYLFYIWIPPLLLIAAITQEQRKWLLAGASLIIIGQVMVNQMWRKQVNTDHLAADEQILQGIRAQIDENEPMVVWGHADRYYVQAPRPMGARLADSWWIIQKGPLQPKRVAEFIYDLEKRQTPLIVDNTGGPDPHRFQFKQSHLLSIPAIAAYVQQHYTVSDSIAGAIFYTRKKQL